MWALAEYALFAFGFGVYAFWVYQMSIAIRGFRAQRPAPPAAPVTRFVVLIPARNEERVIGRLLESLSAQTYPRDRIALYVSCDSSTDDTARVAGANGAHVLIREERSGLGKTANLAWALERIPLDDYDALALFDADNLVREDFFERMNAYLSAYPEADAVQGRLETKNPDDSWVTRVYALSFWYMNRFWHRARSNSGLSINLGGTGAVLRVGALHGWGWSWESLADDLELSCRIILGGAIVHWCDDAVAYDEKPVTTRASHSQRSRWLQGHYYLAARYAWPALGRFARTGRRQFLDLFFLLVVPGRAATNYVTMFGGFAILLVRWFLDPAWLVHDPLWWIWVAFAASAALQTLFVLVVAPSLHFGRVELRYAPDVFSFFAYGLRWLPSMAAAALDSRRSGRWVKTEHSRALSLRDVRRK
jgi:cellulose synthase/poly-beta-1,6-N-acetylglucosamine synthase-like glycosyltransferase